MAYLRMFIIVLFSLFLTVQLSESKKGPCFEFDGSGYLKYNYDYVNITSSAWYKLTFRTRQNEGLLLYAEGSHDYEGLFIRNGTLTYFLYNPTIHGDGGTFGGYFHSDIIVDNYDWFTVDIFRNRKSKIPGKLPSTGMIITKKDGSKEKYIDEGERVGVQISLPVYIGGTYPNLVDGAVNFKGDIKDMKEKLSGTVFNDPTHNSGGAFRCLDVREPV